MLADELLYMKGGNADLLTNGGASSFVKAMLGAERFVFNAEACAAACQVGYSKPSSIIKSLPLARPPFRSVWIEWVPGEMDRAETIATGNAARAGVLLECRNEQQSMFDCTFAWVHRVDGRSSPKAQSHLRLSMIGVKVDLLHTVTSDLPGFSPAGLALKSSYLNEERQATEMLFSHAAPQRAVYMQSYMDDLAQESQERFSKQFTNDYGAAIKYTTFLIACIALINSKNVVLAEAVDLQSTNRLRRLRGKRELLSYSEVKIDLSRSEKSAAARLNLTPAEIRQHIVRGHFKVRKGGIYWWRPFLRGSAEAGKIVRTGYAVEGAPAQMECAA